MTLMVSNKLCMSIHMHNDKGLHTVNKLCYTDTAIPVHGELYLLKIDHP